ncbi:reactive mitochondrial oxygen species modulator 1-domain-containing protein [Catenaria anguillulae PL171]|uniref:Reactive mitochondrial oxygen species modulator 1-domain-containing protein n=1 Tax=Catenaria anguillulae PL171 TaxID=765915 RepID=A0A1Y2HR02_9FUNG|nr:reactive mitochondrial oxygen species modulator 1-domain-containing protein [Catenaria anguillulae PL171]
MDAPQQHGPTIGQKLKMGAMMGTGVGVGLGFILGNIQYLIYGARGKGYLGTLSNSVMTSGITFGFFMMVGSVIRSEERQPVALLSAHPLFANFPPTFRPRPALHLQSMANGNGKTLFDLHCLSVFDANQGSKRIQWPISVATPQTGCLRTKKKKKPKQ